MPGEKEKAATEGASAATEAKDQTTEKAADKKAEEKTEKVEEKKDKAEAEKAEEKAEKKEEKAEKGEEKTEKKEEEKKTEEKGEEKKTEEKEEEKKEEEKKTEEKTEVKTEEKTEEKVEEEKEDVKTMRCVVLTGYGGTRMMKVQEKPQPSPADGEVLIRVHTCGMSFQDLMLRQGIVEPLPKTPFIMGTECAGVVEDVGPNTTDFAKGDRVIALRNYKAWAELVAVPATQVYKLPDDVSFQDGVCLLMHYVTAYILLFDLACLRQGQSLLFHSAAGGVGQALLQLCATVGDVTIFATISTHKYDAVKGKVAHLFPHNMDYAHEIKKLSPQGVDIVLDCLYGEDTNRGIALLKPLGKYVLYGSSNTVTGETKSLFTSAKSWWQVDKVSPQRLLDDNHSIGGFCLRHLLFRQGQHAYIRSIVDKLLDLCVKGKVTPVIDSVWSFEDVGEGMQRLQDRKNIGKVLLDPSKEPKPQEHGKPRASTGDAVELVTEPDNGQNSQTTETTETPASDAQ